MLQSVALCVMSTKHGCEVNGTILSIHVYVHACAAQALMLSPCACCLQVRVFCLLLGHHPTGNKSTHTSVVTLLTEGTV